MVTEAPFASDSISVMCSQEDSTHGSSSADGGVRSSDALFCGMKITFFEFIISCVAIAADMVAKGEPLLSKVLLPLLCASVLKHAVAK